MADNIGYTPGDGATVAADEIGGVLHQRVKLTLGADGVNDGDLSAANPLPITGALTDAQLRAEAVPVQDAHTGNLLLRILQMLLAPLGYDKSQGRQRGTVVVESGTVTAVTTVTTVTTVTGVTTLSNLAAIGGYSAQMTVFDQNRSAWAQCVRARIT